MLIRAIEPGDHAELWRCLEPVIRAGEVFTLPRDLAGEAALAYWLGPAHEVFVACAGAALLGSYYLRENQSGGGGHVANCGFLTAPAAQGSGVGTAMAQHALARARARGFRAMQFNAVVATNRRAIRLWQRLGFVEIGRVPGGFAHPDAGLVDLLIMHRAL
jgi:GNAT superfamily N-acetyltransferase